MRCIAPYCNNDSKENSTETEGVSFHLLPTEPTRRANWLKVLGVTDNLSVKERFHVCSKHFNFEDLYETKNGVRKLKNDAEPVYVELHSYTNSSNLNNLPVCRICLSTESLNGKLVSINTFKVGKAYEIVTGISISKDDKLPQHLCKDCTHRLFSCFRFRSKSLRANSLLLEFLDKYQVLTLKDIVSIDRDKNRLTSTLKVKLFPTNYCDSHVIDKDDETDDEKVYIPLDDVMKFEDDPIYINEFTEPIKEEIEIIEHKIENINGFSDDALDNVNGISDNALDNLSGANDIIKDNVLTDNDNDTADESGINDDDDDWKENSDSIENDSVKEEDLNSDYSSDDNIPLKFRRKVKKGKTKKEVTKKVGSKKASANKVLQQIKGRRTQRKPVCTEDDLIEKLFTITNLSLDEQLADIQNRQHSYIFDHSTFKCMICFKGFQDEDAYKIHMLRHTDKFGDHECKVCRVRFKQPRGMRKHVTANHSQRFSCNQCLFVTTFRSTARLHERWHKGTQYQCPYCPEVFQRETSYKNHKRIKHPTDFICTLCGFSFVSAKGLHMHKNFKHHLDDHQIPEDGPPCEPCGLRFSTQDALEQHLQVSTKHGTDSKGKGSVKRKRNERSKGAGTSLAEGEISCEQCGVHLKNFRAYHFHFRKAHPDKNRTVYLPQNASCMCEECGRILQSVSHLKEHSLTHRGERPYACDECGRRFQTKQNMRAHQARSHARVRPAHECDECGKWFSDKSNLIRHKFIHTGLKPYKCDTCGKCFTTQGEKKTHTDFVHLKKPWPKRKRGTKPAVS